MKTTSPTVGTVALVVLALVACLSFIGSTHFDNESVAHAPVASPSPVVANPPPKLPARGPRTPVLSPRRVPELFAGPAAKQELRKALDELMRAAAGVSCLTVSSGGQRLYEHQAGQPLIPASVQKLLTAVTALDTIGHGTRFRTSVVAAKPPDNGIVPGDVWLVGSGDPLLATDPYVARFENQPQIHTDFEAIADAIVSAGVREIRGTVIGDESRYDRQRQVASWAERFVQNNESGPLSALSVNDGFVQFPPRYDVTLPDFEPAVDPAAHAAGELRQLLHDKGVRIAPAAASGEAPVNATEIAHVESPPLSDIVSEMLRESDNRTAELLVKELGRRERRSGTTQAGLQVVRKTAQELGLPVAGTTLLDGSGLGEGNRSTCELTQTILDQHGPSSQFADMLSVAGETGTLAQRYRGTAFAGRLRGKTGTLRNVIALSGFLATEPGADVTFAFIQNLPPGQIVGYSEAQFMDTVLATLLRYPEGPDLATLAPKPVP